ncbi:agmatine deiminase family protein [Canibacter zhoujuaniae]|uniref:agmatine deiminase family protein n=1 Tax=Canibacter zhoujuaniae TaxID=2708343 RepID=UPI001421B820|nr:agmatine deiminase family protein [Canibacter zhoujuaniae]
MPIEGHKQERLWMAWPTGGYLLGDTAEFAAEAHTTWAAVANAASEFQAVTVVVNPGDEKIARKYLSSSIELLTAPLNDAWMRDIGPSFVLDTDGRLGAVNYVFNGWGQQEWAEWDKDQHIGRIIAEASGATLINSDMVNEGGGIQVDGTGRVIITETVQLDPGRNPEYTKEMVEAELQRTIGTDSVLWLPRGLYRDHDEFGTRGHSDILAAFATPEVLLMHEQRDTSHPDHEIARNNLEIAKKWLAERGDKTEIITLPAPSQLRDAEDFVDYSYINHVVINDAVIACAFGDAAADDYAQSVLGEVYPGRKIVGIDARPIFARGGGIHCITQQQPQTQGDN